MTSNAVFYTFSTIAQTLAGAIALLGALVLYRLQSSKMQIDSDSHAVSGGYQVSGSSHDVVIANTIRSLHDTVSRIFVSVVALATAPRIMECPAGPTLLFAVGIAWFGACMASYFLLVRTSLA